MSDPPPRARRPWLTAALPALLVAGGLLWNWQLARTCPLWVVNHTPQDAQILRGEERLATVLVGQTQAIPLGEGRHALRIERREGADEVQVELRRGFWERFADRAPYVLNVARAAALRWEEGVYAGGDDVRPPRPPRVWVGESFLRVEEVDYVFRPLPDALEGSAPGGERATSLTALHGGILQALGAFPRATPPEVQLRFLALRLPLEPADVAALDYLLELSREEGRLEQAQQVLRGMLSRRPPLIDWHRAHQDLARELSGEDAVRAEYARLAAAEPQDAALQYLAGRLEADPAAAEARYARALELDPGLGWAWHGRAYLRAARGELGPAREAALEAVRALPGAPEVQAQAWQLRLLDGQAAEVRAELLAREQERGLEPGHLRRLLEACLAAGDLEGARAACGRYAGAREGSRQPGASRRALLAELTLDELEGRWEQVLARLEGLDRPGARELLRAAALLELGRLEELEPLLAPAGPLASATREPLLLSLAWSLRGEEARAVRWREVAAERLAAGSARERLAARALRAADPLAELPRVALGVGDQAALLLTLAAAHPQARAQLLARAAPLVARGELFPARYLRRVQAALEAR